MTGIVARLWGRMRPVRSGAASGGAAHPSAGVAPPAASPAGRDSDATADRELRDALAGAVAGLRDRVAGVPAMGDAEVLLAGLDARGDLRIRQLPAAAQQALALCDDPDTDVERLALLVRRDPFLTQHVLREANAAFYAAGAPVVSVQAAIGRIGTTGVRGAVLRSVLDGMVCRPGGAYEPMVRAAWEHMVRVAPLARRLAPSFDAHPEEAYVLGLLHDVGKLVLFDQVASLRGELRRPVEIPRAVLVAVLRTLHEPLGGLAVLGWGLGDAAARAVARHHRQPPPDGRDPLGEAVFLAERLDLAASRGVEPDLDALWTEGQLPGTPDRVWPVLGAGV